LLVSKFKYRRNFLETLLTQGLQARQDKIQDAGQYLQETKRLFQQFGQKN
jgi:hypothetical protein